MFIGLNIGIPNGGGKAKLSYSSYLGPVATRGRLNNFYSTSNSVKYIQSRTRHVATDNIASAKLVFADIYPSGTSENAVSLTGTITASIEYPAGTFNQVLFGGSATGTLNNTILESDLVALSTPIPNGAEFWVRNYRVGAGGNYPYSTDGLNWFWGSASGESCDAGSTARTDKTMAGTITNNSFNNIIYRPTAIIGYTTKPTFYILGDSRSRISEGGGSLDMNLDINGLVGSIEPAVGVTGCGYINGAVSGDSYFNITQAGVYTKRALLADYCTHIIDMYGINDLGVAGTLSVGFLNSYVGTMHTLFGSTKPYYRCTLGPRSSSTDAWRTLVNQTAVASSPYRIAWNNAMRDGSITNANGFIEIADYNESSRDSGLYSISTMRTLTNDVSSTLSSTTVTSAGGNFLSSDAGKSLVGIGGGTLRVITNSTTATIQSAATATNVNVTAMIGTLTRDGLHNTAYADSLIAAGNPFGVIY